MTDAAIGPGGAIHARNDAAPRRGRGGRRTAGSIPNANLAPGSLVFLVTTALLGCALLFGGASRENAVQVMILELLSLPLIALALWRLQGAGKLRRLRIPLALIAAAFAAPLVQLIPIPFDAWRALPGHADLADGLKLAGATRAWLPMSLTPDETWRSALALLVPTAVFLGAVACTTTQKRLLTGLVLIAAGISLFLGIMQMAGGPQSPLRFYPTTNEDSAVGLFANRNHLATLLLVSVPLMAIWIQELARARQRSTLIVAGAALPLLGLITVGVAITHSRGGLVLIVPAFAGSMLVLWRSGGRSLKDPLVIGAGLVGLLTLIGAMSAIQATLARFPVSPAEEVRLLVWPSVIETLKAFFPFGSGIGSFIPVYRIHEPVTLMGPEFLNAAHNDYLQGVLEGGLLAALVAAAVGAWVGWRALKAWRGAPDAASNLARAGSVVAAIILLHSAVDYPLRTLAIASVFALACALLVRPTGASFR
jgi:O-antigen ligase